MGAARAVDNRQPGCPAPRCRGTFPGGRERGPRHEEARRGGNRRLSVQGTVRHQPGPPAGAARGRRSRSRPRRGASRQGRLAASDAAPYGDGERVRAAELRHSRCGKPAGRTRARGPARRRSRAAWHGADRRMLSREIISGLDIGGNVTSYTEDVGVRLGSAIRARRHLLGMTLVEVAASAGLSHPFLSQLERGLARPSMRSLTAIAATLGTTAQALMAASELPAVPDAEPVSVVRRAEVALVDSPGGSVRPLGRGELAMLPVEVNGAPRHFDAYY